MDTSLFEILAAPLLLIETADDASPDNNSYTIRANPAFEQFLNQRPCFVVDTDYRQLVKQQIAQDSLMMFPQQDAGKIPAAHISIIWLNKEYEIQGNWIHKQTLLVQIIATGVIKECDSEYPVVTVCTTREIPGTIIIKKDDKVSQYYHNHALPAKEKALENFCALYREEIPYIEVLLKKLAAEGAIKKYRSGEQILPLGSPADHVGIVLHGLARRYTLSADARDITILFHRAGTIFDQIRFINQGMSGSFGIEAIRPTMTLAIPAATVRRLSETDPRMYRLFYTNLARRLIARFERDTMLLSANCYDRYKDFIKNYPDVASSAKSIHIASYLGMTLENLSRIRTKLKNEYEQGNTVNTQSNR